MNYFEVIRTKKGRTIKHRKNWTDAKVFAMYQRGGVKSLSPHDGGVEVELVKR